MPKSPQKKQMKSHDITINCLKPTKFHTNAIYIPYTIWLFDIHGKPLTGGSNGKIIYKWAIYTMAMLVITRG